MIRCIAIDDEPLALQQLATYINKVSYLQLVARCQSAVEARRYLKNDTVDAVFCDINMPDLNGMDFVKSLVAPPLVVFTTAYSEYAVEGFRVNAVDYLLKPFGMQDFLRAANRLRAHMELQRGQTDVSGRKHDDAIFLKTESRMVRVAVASIRYVEAMSEYLKVYVDGEEKPIVTLLSMKKMEDYLPSSFMRIHRSYIVNLEKIQEVGKNRVIISRDLQLPVGDTYREALQQYLSVLSVT